MFHLREMIGMVNAFMCGLRPYKDTLLVHRFGQRITLMITLGKIGG
jgi:hypothetical protein